MNVFCVSPYIAPEVRSGEEEYSKFADVYSYGIIVYEINNYEVLGCYFNKNSGIVIQIKEAEEFSADQESTNTIATTPLTIKYKQFIPNEENFERDLEELPKSMSLKFIVIVNDNNNNHDITEIILESDKATPGVVIIIILVVVAKMVA
ncbi:hypothetical protein Glove_130g10 [Diversispora epigaea]|uniref:Protein kinase domain-containing protein n=1 Tax=Diversispora epigaea TaxID=1348612 RepID=A0A397J2P0_9GLOM|nr:hypothetical protein Glove_130g10 [Diversispora epigaea]